MMKQDITITEELSGQRIDSIASQFFANFSRSQIQKSAVFRLKNKEFPGKTKAKEGETWQITIVENAVKNLNKTPAWNLPLKILTQSKTWVIIEKPLNISVHPSPSAPEPKTIVNALVHHFGQNLAENSDELDGQTVAKPGLVHRLDKGTSGVLLVAKTNKTHHFFQKNWSKVKKTYLAVVENKGKKLPQKGKINSPITRDKNNRQRMTVSNKNSAKNALTYFKKLEENKEKTLVEVNIPTGRTHQIRVHFSAIGHPVHGDEKYGGSIAERVFLHAYKLEFPDPDQKNKVTKVSTTFPLNFSLE